MSAHFLHFVSFFLPCLPISFLPPSPPFSFYIAFVYIIFEDPPATLYLFCNLVLVDPICRFLPNYTLDRHRFGLIRSSSFNMMIFSLCLSSFLTQSARARAHSSCSLPVRNRWYSRNANQLVATFCSVFFFLISLPIFTSLTFDLFFFFVDFLLWSIRLLAFPHSSQLLFLISKCSQSSFALSHNLVCRLLLDPLKFASAFARP